MEMAIKTFFKILKYGQTHLNLFFDYFQDVKYSVIQSLKVGNKFKISFHEIIHIKMKKRETEIAKIVRKSFSRIENVHHWRQRNL